MSGSPLRISSQRQTCAPTSLNAPASCCRSDSAAGNADARMSLPSTRRIVVPRPEARKISQESSGKPPKMLRSAPLALGPAKPRSTTDPEVSDILTLERNTNMERRLCTAPRISRESTITNPASSRQSRKFASILPFGEQYAPYVLRDDWMLVTSQLSWPCRKDSASSPLNCRTPRWSSDASRSPARAATKPDSTREMAVCGSGTLT